MAPDTATDTVRLEEIDTIIVNDVEIEPAALLALPTDRDIETMRKKMKRMYESVKYDYERMEADEMPELVAERGSLSQEMLAQINSQTQGGENDE